MMQLSVYQSANKALLDNAWVDTDNAFYLQLLSSSYIYDETHSSTLDAAPFVVGFPILLTNRAASGFSITCDPVQMPVSTASAAIIFIGTNPLFYFQLNDGLDYDLTASDKIELDDLVTAQVV